MGAAIQFESHRVELAAIYELEQDADVLAFVFSRNKFPAGRTELYKQAEMLKEIKFESEKPAEKK